MSKAPETSAFSMPDFSSLSMEELQEVLNTVSALLEGKKDARRQQLLAELTALGGSARKPRVASAEPGNRKSPEPKYRSKKDPNVTWSGRGGTAKWLVAEMQETGLTKEAFLIK